MKHYLPIPFGTDALGRDIGGWLFDRGWRLTGLTQERFGYTPQDLIVTVMLEPYAFPAATITARSGAVLIYDDVSKSMGVSLEPEPQDAVPVEPEDAVPSFVEQHADTTLLEPSKQRRRSGILNLWTTTN